MLTVDNFPEIYSLAVEHDLEHTTQASKEFAVTELERVIRFEVVLTAPMALLCARNACVAP